MIGHINGVWGVAESARLIYWAFLHHIPTNAVNLHEPVEYSYADYGIATTRAPGFMFNIVVLNADSAPVMYKPIEPTLVAPYSRSLWRHRYNIGYWAYELESLPLEQGSSALIYDEIWATSRFTADAIRDTLAKDPATAQIPVLAMPVGVPKRPVSGAADKARWGWRADSYVFLVVYDTRSIVARKNPLGVVKAFQRAFSRADTSVRLVIKSHGTQAGDAHQRNLTALIAGWTNIELLHRTFDEEAFHSLSSSIDCYVSLHRSEGFGLNILKFILQGTPTIATTYSGSMDFMRHLPQTLLNNLGVKWAPKVLDEDAGPYPAGNRWSEPSVEDAARAMRYAKANQAAVKAVAKRAAKAVFSKFSSKARGAEQAARLSEIAKGLAAKPWEMKPRPEDCYWAQNRDLRNAFVGAALHVQTLKNHWEGGGRREGRSQSCDWLSARVLQTAMQSIPESHDRLA